MIPWYIKLVSVRCKGLQLYNFENVAHLPHVLTDDACDRVRWW